MNYSTHSTYTTIRLWTCVLFFLLFARFAAAQTNTSSVFAVWPFADIRYGTMLSLNREPGFLNRFATEGYGTSFELGTAIGLDLQFPYLFGSRMGASFRVGADITGGKFTSDTYLSTARDSPNVIVESTQQFTVEASAMSVYMEGRMAYSISDRINIFAGPWLTYRFASSALQREHILSPEKAVFIIGGGNERIVAEGDGLLASAVQYGVRVGASFSTRLSPSLFAQPEISVNANISALESQSLISTLRPTFGIGFRLDAPEPVLIEPPVLPPPQLSIFAIDGSGHKSDTASLSLHTTSSWYYIALPPFILFDSLSVLSNHFALLSPAEADKFSADTLTSLWTRDIYRQLLNIIGWRMRSDTGSTFVLASAPEYADRAEAVRQYLVHIWKIDSARVTTLTRRNTSLPRSAVVLRASSTALLAPLVLQAREESSRAPAIGLEKDVPAGWTQWTIELQHNGRTIRTIDSTRAESDLHAVSFPLAAVRSHRTQPKVVALLTASSASGQRALVADSLILRLDNSKTAADTVHIYVLPDPLPGMATMKSINNILLARLQEFADSNTEITVTISDITALPYASEVSEQIIGDLDAQNIRPAAFSLTSAPQAAGSTPSFIRITARKPQ